MHAVTRYIDRARSLHYLIYKGLPKLNLRNLTYRAICKIYVLHENNKTSVQNIVFINDTVQDTK